MKATINSMNKRIFIIKLPMRIQSSKKKKTALNLNIYRNLHHRSLHAQKKNFYKIVSKLLKNIPKLGRIHLHYEVFPQTKRRLDIMNVGSVVDKYFSDTLTEMRIIEDDDYTNINFISFGFGGLSQIEKVIVKITEIEPRKKDMKIVLEQCDIEIAISTYLKTRGFGTATRFDLFKAESGNIEAEITIDGLEPKKEIPFEPDEIKPKRRGRGPAKSKNKSGEIDNVAEADDDSSTNSGGGSLENDEKKTNEKKSDSTGGSKSKNPFEDENGPSSESEDTSGQKEKTTSVNKPKEVKKKASIFDS